MSMLDRRPNGAGGSFLPEDYLQKKAEKRQLILGLGLFLVVAFAMVGAFFVTYRKWSTVMSMQAAVNREWVEQEKKIEQLKVLEAQRDELKAKAETTTALLERVQRSTLLAEMINRMPDQLTLTDLQLKGRRLVVPVKAAAPVSGLAGPQTTASVGARATTPAGGGAPPDAPKPRPAPAQFEFSLEIAGLASSDEEVADYVASLVQCPLLDRVEMISAGETTVQDVSMRKFKIEARIRSSADTRTIEALHVPRLGGRPDGTARRPKHSDPMDPTQSRPDDPNFDASKAQRSNAEDRP